MGTTSFTLEYFLCSLHPKGFTELINGETGAAILCASAILELQLEKIIDTDEKKRFIICQELPADKNYLKPVYDYIKNNRPKTIESLGEEFSYGGKLPKALFTTVAESLVQLGDATKFEKQGVFKTKIYCIPNAQAVIKIVDKIRAELLEEGKITDEVVILSALLEKNSLIKKYFSKYERGLIQQRLKEIRKSDSYQMITKLLDSMDNWFAVFTATFMMIT